MSISKRIIEETLLGEKPEITSEIVEYYRMNPDDLDLIIDKEYFHSKFIRLFFIIGMMLAICSRIMKLIFQDTWLEFINDIILDIVSELGIAIFGGAIVAYILEKLRQKQFQDNVKLRNEIVEKIKDLENKE